VSADHIFDYLNLESADYQTADRFRFRFARTAKIKDRRYWLWEYTESNGEKVYVYVESKWPRTILSLRSANGLSPEQFLLADFYDKLDWS